MKPNYEFIPNLKASFYSYRLDQPYFEFKWHYHPEYEITYVLKGGGRRLVGDIEEGFVPGDLILIGSNIPHGYYSEPEDGNIKAIGIQFSPRLFSPELLSKEEFIHIHKLLDHARTALFFAEDSAMRLHEAILKAHTEKGIKKYMALIELLDQMGADHEPKPLLERPLQAVGKNSNNPLEIALEYIHDNLEKNLTIDDMARHTNMTRTSFCRFFRKKTGTTFTNYLNELRIGRVCLELVTSDDRISELAFNSGFNSLSHFNRVFVAKKGVSPTTYRRHFSRVSVNTEELRKNLSSN